MMGESTEAQASGNSAPAAEMLGALIHLVRQPDTTLPQMREFANARAGNAVFLKMSQEAMQFGMELRRLDNGDNVPRKNKTGEIMRRVIIFGPGSKEVQDLVTMNGRFAMRKLPPAPRLLYTFYEAHCRREAVPFTEEGWRDHLDPAHAVLQD